ncbi:hypothetical protein [Burkholderia sp. Bp9031]|uniref:hypothetical protein n=1 Tax=Burkholderia sp. Bp9031 TaxID=2184566 RepID=UPI000F5DED90|nr:hypothetical protein [Burkholderia sp. Bp9031]
MDTFTGYKRFSRCVLDWSARIITAAQKDNIEIGGSFWGAIAGKPVVASPTPLIEKHQALIDIFYEYTEVHETLEAIKDIRVYVARFPFSGTRVSPGRYLAHQVGIYLNEIYILRVRLVTLTKEIQNKLSKSSTKSVTAPLIKPLFKIIKTSFDGIEKTRGHHVHTRRFSDDDIRRISTLELLSSEIDWAKDLSRFVYKQTRRQWLTRMLNNEKVIEELLDHYGDALWSSLFAPGMMFDMSELPEKLNGGNDAADSPAPTLPARCSGDSVS